MIAKILRLRIAGVPLRPGPAAAADGWSEEGYLELVAGARGRRLCLRALQSAPGFGVLHELHAPQLTRIKEKQICFRGIEKVETAAGDAAVVQEWVVELTR